MEQRDNSPSHRCGCMPHKPIECRQTSSEETENPGTEKEEGGDLPVRPGIETPNTLQALLEQLLQETTPSSGKYEICQLLGSQPRVPKEQEEQRATKSKHSTDKYPEILEERPGKACKISLIEVDGRQNDLDQASDRECSAQKFTGVQSSHAKSDSCVGVMPMPSSTSLVQPSLLTTQPLPCSNTLINHDLANLLPQNKLDDGTIHLGWPQLDLIGTSATRYLDNQLESRRKGEESSSGYTPWTWEGYNHLELRPEKSDHRQNQNVKPSNGSMHDPRDMRMLAKTANLPNPHYEISSPLYLASPSPSFLISPPPLFLESSSPSYIKSPSPSCPTHLSPLHLAGSSPLCLASPSSSGFMRVQPQAGTQNQIPEDTSQQMDWLEPKTLSGESGIYRHVRPGSIQHAVRAEPSFDKLRLNHPFHGNPILYPFKQVSLAKLHEYFHHHPMSNSQRQYENNTDTIILIIDTLLNHHLAASYSLALHSCCICGLLGPVGGFPPMH